MTALIMVIFVILLMIAVPIGIAVGITAMLPSLLTESFTVSGVYITRSMLGGINQTTLLAIPLFVLSGIIMARGGVSKKIFDVFSYFIGNLTAGIPCAVIATCLFFGAISGSAPATVAAVGSMTIPVMLEMGYDKKFTVALVAVSGGLGVIIPPSIPFILYAQAAGASVSDLFLAGVIPGLTVGAILMGYSIFYCKRHGEDKESIHRIVDELHKQSFGKVFFNSIWALLTPVIILGCIYSGITSPTEAAAISVAYSLIISLFVYRTLKFNELWAIFVEATRTYTPILFILAASVAFSRILTLLQIPQTVSVWITTSFTSKVAVLLIVNVILLIVGMIMDTTGHRLCNTAHRCQSFCRLLPVQGTGRRHCPEGHAYDHHVPHRPAALYFCPVVLTGIALRKEVQDEKTEKVYCGIVRHPADRRLHSDHDRLRKRQRTGIRLGPGHGQS